MTTWELVRGIFHSFLTFHQKVYWWRETVQMFDQDFPIIPIRMGNNDIPLKFIDS